MNVLLKLGSKGSEVQQLTETLAARGHLEQRRLRTAVIGFQSQDLNERGLPLKVDGIVGPVTGWALRHPRVTAANRAAEPAARVRSFGYVRRTMDTLPGVARVASA